MVNERIDPDFLDELWLCQFSCASWCESQRWEKYFDCAQEILGAHITHLDENDPVRRRVAPNGLRDAAKFVTRFGARESSRWLYGRVPRSRADFSIQLFGPEERRVNSINWYFRQDFLEHPEQLQAVNQLFMYGNNELSAFYAYSDRNRLQMAKARETGAINILEELLGVFWLTYFGDHYVDFFGRDRVVALEGMGIQVKFGHGAALLLAETPELVPSGLRRAAEEFLGAKSFVDPTDLRGKRPGQYALTFDQLQKQNL